MTKKKIPLARLSPRLPGWYAHIMAVVIISACLTAPAYAATDLWTAAQTIIVDIYSHIATLSTALAGLKRIWICWAIINGIGAFLAYITPHFSGLATITP